MSEQPIAARPVRRRATDEAPAGPIRARAFVCEAASCMSSQAHDVTLRLGEAVTDAGLTDVQVKRVGCLGLCAAGPLVEIPETGRLFSAVTPDGVDEIVEALKAVTEDDTPQPQGPFFEKQVRVVTENFGRVDPESLDDYLARGGYEALTRVLNEMTSTEVREEITRSGLRGRGGAGYSDRPQVDHRREGRRHAEVRDLQRRRGRPGRVHGPQRPRERPATGSSRGWRSRRSRSTPPRATSTAGPNTRSPSRACARPSAMPSAPGSSARASPTPRSASTSQVRLGAGAFVCGEETALIASIEGKRGNPQPRPPYPAVSGLFDSPTLINNVETFANVPTIIRKGADWYAAIGSGKSRGTKVFALAGRIVNTGLIEVPMGIDAARDHLRHRRRHPGRTAVQGRADRRPVRRLHPSRVPRHPGELRDPARARLVHGLGRHDRHGRPVVHGGRRQVLHGLLP